MKTSDLLKDRREALTKEYADRLDVYVSQKLLTKKQLSDLVAGFEDGYTAAFRVALETEKP